MNVLCIDDTPSDNLISDWILKTGEIYNVISTHVRRGLAYYELREQPAVGYLQELFIPIDPTEDEVKEYCKPEKVIA